MEKLEQFIKDLQDLNFEFINRKEVLNRITEIHQALQLHKTQVSGSVFVKVLVTDKLPPLSEWVFFKTKYGAKKMGFLSIKNTFITHSFIDPIEDVEYWLQEVE